MMAALLADWSLRTDGDAWSGAAATVQPVITADGRVAVLKINKALKINRALAISTGEPSPEHEHLALRRWGGQAAVSLYSADPHRSALLLERADPTRTPAELNPVGACTAIAGLYRSLHVPALPQLRTLSDLAAGWAERLHALHDHPAVPRRLVDHAVSLAARFADDPDTDGRLIHTDLHYDNVLGSGRAGQPEWLAISPKPLSGDPHFELAPLLEHRWDEVVTGGDVRSALLDRIYAVVDAAELDEDRARDWIIVRELVAVLTALDAQHQQPATDRVAADRATADRVTRAIVIAKAAQR